MREILLTLLISATRAPSLGVYTLWLFALMRLWMVNSSTSRFPFSWNLKQNKNKSRKKIQFITKWYIYCSYGMIYHSPLYTANFKLQTTIGPFHSRHLGLSKEEKHRCK